MKLNNSSCDTTTQRLEHHHLILRCCCANMMMMMIIIPSSQDLKMLLSEHDDDKNNENEEPLHLMLWCCCLHLPASLTTLATLPGHRCQLQIIKQNPEHGTPCSAKWIDHLILYFINKGTRSFLTRGKWHKPQQCSFKKRKSYSYSNRYSILNTSQLMTNVI